MKKRTGFIFAVGSALVFSACTIPFMSKQQAALQVNSTPTASVYLNGNHVGQTPVFNEKLKPGEYTVRLLVDNDPSKDWTTKVNVAPRIVSIINKNFGVVESESSNYFLQLEPLADKNAVELSILTIPDNVIVKVDGQPQGFSPVSIKDSKEGDHTIVLSTPGYQEMTIIAQAKTGYKLIVVATLGRASQVQLDPNIATPSAAVNDATKSAVPTTKLTPSPKVTVKPTPAITLTPTKKPTVAPSTATGSAEISRPYVIIKETGTGWLRVRATASTSAEELGRVNVGESYPYIESNTTGWFKIEYETGKEGWITGRYADLYK